MTTFHPHIVRAFLLASATMLATGAVGAPHFLPAQAGDLETRALLYGTVDGELRALAVAHAAQWLEPGSQSLVLRFAAGLLAGASGPYELRDLTLLDQGRMGVLQRQQRGVSIDEADVGAHAAAARPAERVKMAPVSG